MEAIEVFDTSAKRRDECSDWKTSVFSSNVEGLI